MREGLGQAEEFKKYRSTEEFQALLRPPHGAVLK
jgi:hypothetical protein